jgi:hypothetical protein
LPVCMHPAYEHLLPEAAPLLERVAAPLVGIPGGPVRADHRSILDQGLSPDGTLAFRLFSTGGVGLPEQFGQSVASSLVADRDVMLAGGTRDLNDTQRMLLNWLMLQAGLSPTGAFQGPEVRAALERFEGIDAEVRREWLEENYLALRT